MYCKQIKNTPAKLKGFIFHIKFLFPLLLLLSCISSCEKDYSYEGGAAGGSVPDTTTVPIDTTTGTDTLATVAAEFPYCSFCYPVTALQESRWSFKIDTVLLCGSIDQTVVNVERNAFIFYGLSSCGQDTGLAFKVYLNPVVLDRDITDYTASYASVDYYHTGFPNIFSNLTNQSVNFTISSYIHATQIATGTFSGTVFRQNGSPVNISGGKFKIKLI